MDVKQAVSITVDLIPVVENVKSGFEAAFGFNPITLDKLSKVDRGIAVAGILGGPLVKGVKHGSKMATAITSNVADSLNNPAVVKTFDKLKDSIENMKSNMTLKTDNDFAFATAGSGKDNRSNVSYPDHSVDGKKSDITTSKQENKPVTTGTAKTKQTEVPQTTATKSNQQNKGTDKETYQHLKDYKNNKYFTRSVEYNAGKDGTGFTYKVYQRGDINWDMVRTKGAKKGRGLTNAEASAKYGLAPILDDAGSVATLHHSQQKGVGPLYEASTRYHNISNAKRAPLHPYKGKLNPFYPMDETTRGAFQKVDSINYWKIRGEEALGGK